MYQPNYKINNQILRNVARLEANIAVMQLHIPENQTLAELQQQQMVTMAHHSSLIEGNELNQQQVQQVIQLHTKQTEEIARSLQLAGHDRDIQEILNFYKVLQWVVAHGKQANTSYRIDEKLLAAMHELVTYRIVPDTERGQFRSMRVMVQYGESETAQYQAPPAVEIPYLLEDMLQWLHQAPQEDVHPVILAGIIEAELLRIYPYIEGSGLVNRGFSLLLRAAYNYECLYVVSIEEYFTKHLEAYNQVLLACLEKPEDYMTDWLAFYTGAYAEQSEAVKHLMLTSTSRTPQTKATSAPEPKGLDGLLPVEETSPEPSRVVQISTPEPVVVTTRQQPSVPQVALSERQIRILDFMRQNNNRAVSADLQEELPDVSLDTILRDIKDLSEKDMVIKRGRTKGAYYELLV